MTLRPSGILATLVLACVAWGPATAADADAAERFIANLGERTVKILQEPDLDLEGATANFRELFLTNFDVPTIGRFALGRYWRMATPPQREEFLDLFETLVVKTYARRFSEYSGQDFRVDGSRALSERDTLVSTTILDEDGNLIVVIDWRVRERESRQWIIDVVVEQVSMGVTQRSDYSAVIQRGGGKVEVLLAALRDQVQTAQNEP